MKYMTGLLSLLVLPCATQAADFDYTFVEAGIVNTEVDVGPFSIDGDGLGFNGSYAFSDSMQFIGGYSTQDYDFGIDGSLLSVGVGFNSSLTDSLDFVADLSYLDAEVATALGSADENGYGIGAGVRALVGSGVELEGGIVYQDIESSDTALRIGGRYHFSPMWAVGASFIDEDTGLSWNIGVRASFGR